ncbi:MAG: hydroxysqualene dehydroxylase HpnE [Pseudomonadota bacterium]
MSSVTAPGVTHVVGAGLAGLSAAVRLAQAGRRVRVYEAAPQAGGRCRSFYDAQLDRMIDNGNHLVLSGNHAVSDYLDLVGGSDHVEIGEACFPFFDPVSGERWEMRLADGAVQWKLLLSGGGIPGAGVSDWRSLLPLLMAKPHATVADIVGTTGVLHDRFWEPMTWAVLNTTPARGSARLLAPVLRETFARGGRHCRVVTAPDGWGAALIDPAIRYLEAHGGTLQFHTTLERVDRGGDGRIAALSFAGETVMLQSDDDVVLALPRARLARLLPGITVPDGDATIVNAHFRLDAPLSTRSGRAVPPLIGLVNARAHWVFVRDDVISITISAADALGLDREPAESILPLLWQETIAALDLAPDTSYAAGRLIRERRATFDQSPDSVARRPPTRTAWSNLVLAGDWVDTGLPATIEGAIRSGVAAARALMDEGLAHTKYTEAASGRSIAT